MKEHQLRLRDYQQEGKTRLNQHFISHYLPLLKGALYENLSRPTPETESSEAEKFPLIHMATGAGKTFTVNQFVNDLFRWRAL